MRSDEKIQQDVIDQLRWNPMLKASQIGVAVRNGIVTLSGQVDTYLKKLEAEKDATRVFGVKAIAEDIQIGVSLTASKTDSEIAESVVNAFSWNTSIPDGLVKIKVENGMVTLTGEVEWEYQRKAATEAISKLMGVRLVLNNITLKPRAFPNDLKDKISAALERTARLEAKKINVEVRGGKVILKGQVKSVSEKQDAANAVWAAQGVFSVDNQLVVETESELV